MTCPAVVKFWACLSLRRVTDVLKSLEYKGRPSKVTLMHPRSLPDRFGILLVLLTCAKILRSTCVFNLRRCVSQIREIKKHFFLITSDFEEKVKILFSILDMHNTEASDNWLQRVDQLVSFFSQFWTMLSLGIDSDTIN